MFMSSILDKKFTMEPSSVTSVRARGPFGSSRILTSKVIVAKIG
jgi:hypothetical protein